jgi:hypothetical protein
MDVSRKPTVTAETLNRLKDGEVITSKETFALGALINNGVITVDALDAAKRIYRMYVLRGPELPDARELVLAAAAQVGAVSSLPRALESVLFSGVFTDRGAILHRAELLFPAMRALREYARDLTETEGEIEAAAQRALSDPAIAGMRAEKGDDAVKELFKTVARAALKKSADD